MRFWITRIHANVTLCIFESNLNYCKSNSADNANYFYTLIDPKKYIPLDKSGIFAAIDLQPDGSKTSRYILFY